MIKLIVMGVMTILMSNIMQKQDTVTQTIVPMFYPMEWRMSMIPMHTVATQGMRQHAINASPDHSVTTEAFQASLLVISPGLPGKGCL